jgi:Lar family restriction alleviation protein
MERRKLKPCPFCGGEAKFYTVDKYDRVVWKVMCGARVDCCLLLNDFDTREEAINAWNERA